MLAACPADAQEILSSSDDYIVQVWDTGSGLPDNTVTTIAQTPDGYIWVGTLHGGLARFDGSRFVTFTPNNTPELKSIEIQKLLVDTDGTLWIGVETGRLISYRDGKFYFERENDHAPASWLGGVVAKREGKIVLSSIFGWLFSGTAIAGTNHWETFEPSQSSESVPCEDRTGVIWYRTSDARLAQVRNGTNGTRLEHPPGLRSAQINTVFKDATGQVWVGTEKEIAVWDGKAFRDMTPTNGERDLAIREVIPCADGSLWVRTDDKLRRCYGRQWVVEAGPLDEDFWKIFQEIRLMADSKAGLWALHHGDGIWHVGREGNVARVGPQQGLPNGLAECCFEDREGNIWVGLTDGGLACIRPRIFHTIWPEQGLQSRSAHSVCEDALGTMWFGTAGQNLLHWSDGRFTSVTPPAESAAGHEISVLANGPGRMWVGTVQGGLWLLDNGRFSRPFPSSDIGTVVRCMHQDHLGRLWIGNEFGLFCWANGVLKKYTKTEGFAPGYVLSIAEDQAGDLWLGTAVGQLRRLHNGKLETFIPQDSLTDRQTLLEAEQANPMESQGRGSLSGGERFWALHFDNDGVLWIGSLGGGLLQFKDGKFTRFTTREGVPDDYVSQILEDGRGQIWLGTRVGIARAAKKNLNTFARGTNAPLTFITYGKYDGLPAVQCSGGNQPNCWKSRDGRLWFSTVSGAVWVDPTVLHVNHLPPPVQIEEMLVDGERVTGNATARSGPRPPNEIFITAGRHYFEFKFTALSFTSPDKVKFKWRLKDLESSWVDGGYLRAVSYSFIPPGAYEFEVQACNNDGVWNEQGAALKFTVLPYFWQRWWFKIGAALFMCAVLLMIYYVRIARLRALEKMRLRIARDLHDEVGANLGSISLLAQMMEQTPSSVDASEVRGIAVRTIDTLRDIIWFIDPKHDRLSDLVERLRETARVMLPGMSLKFDQTGDFNSADLSLAFRRNVLPLFKETLHNVLKHSHASTVEISVRRRENEFQFSIKDNGVGFDPAQKYSGNGLKNLKRRAAEIGGRLEIASHAGGGTTVTLSASITQTRDW